jgi:NOL1/NOP2/fmu family ribosome biogenesis protein
MFGKITAIVAGVVMLVAVLVYGSFALYEGSWSLAAHNQQHSLELQQKQANGEASIAVSSWNYQTMLGQQITKGIDNVTIDTTQIGTATQQYGSNSIEVTDLKSQREADGNTVCTQAEQVNGTLPSGMFQTTWIDKNCLDGSISPSSAYYYVGS